MISHVLVCPYCDTTTVLKIPDKAARLIEDPTIPVRYLWPEATDLELRQLESSMCVDCINDSNEQINSLLNS